MATVEHAITIDRTPEEVWALTGEFGGLETWMAGVESCIVDGDRRTVGITGGIEVVETLVERDEDRKLLAYSITEGPLPATSHLSTITVVPEGDGSRVTWAVDVEPDDLAPLLGGMYEGALGALKAFLEG